MINKSIDTSKQTENKFKIGDNICCASHGIGKIVDIEDKEYLGSKIIFCNIFFSKDKMKLLIPLTKMKEVGIRTLITKDMVSKIMKNILTKTPKAGKGIWTKRIIECEVKLYSGSALLTAEVVRDLFVGTTMDSSRSYSERTIFEKCLNRLVSEFAIVLEITESEANKMIFDTLSAKFGTINNNKISSNDSLDGDFADSDIDEKNYEDFVHEKDGDEDNEIEVEKKSKKVA